MKILSLYIRLFVTALCWLALAFFNISQGTTSLQAKNTQLTSEERAWIEVNPRFKVGAFDLAPYIMLEDGHVTGYMTELIQAISSQVGLEPEFQFDTLQQVMMAIRDGTLHATMGLIYNPKRAEFLFHSKDKFSITLHIFTREENNAIRSLEDLKGKRLASYKSYSLNAFYDKYLPDVHVIKAPDVEGMFRLVATGKADAAIQEIHSGESLLRRYLISNVQQKGLAVFAEKESYQAHYYGVGHQWPMLASILDKGHQLLPKAEKQRIWNRWFSANETVTESFWLTPDEKAWLDNTAFRRQLLNDWMPFNTRDESGNVIGIAEDYWTLISDKLGLKEITFSPGPGFSEVLQMLRGDEVDILHSATQTEDRDDYAIFSDSYVEFPIAIANHKELGPIFSPSALEFKLVSVGRENGAYHKLKALYPGIRFLQVKDTREALEKVVIGEAEAAVDMLPVLQYHIDHYYSANLKLAGVTNIQFPVQVMVSRKYDQLIPLVNRAISSITPKEHNDIQQKWMMREVITTFDYSLLWKSLVVTIMGMTLLFSLYWNKSLNRKVHQRTSQLGEELALREASEEKLRKSESELRLAANVFKNTKEGIIITDSDCSIIAVNEAFISLSGYSKADVIGENPRMWQSEHHDEDFYQEMWASLGSQDHWQGEVWNRNKDGNIFPTLVTINAIKNDQGELVNYISVYSDITSLKESEKRLQHLAHHDPLTNLPNRLLFQIQLEQSIKRSNRHSHNLCVMFLDLDNFKSINDAMGHPAGDKLLKEVANRLRLLIRDEDTVARISGDEFAIILDQIEDVRNASRVAEKILGDFENPISVDGKALRATFSIGISTYPGDSEDATTLVKYADSAMYLAKQTGKNRYYYYCMDITKQAVERIELESSMQVALEQNQLIVFYQPQYSMSTGRLIGAEALLRWKHPVQGFILPDKFIPIAENTGLINSIGEWVLYEACAQLKKWQEKGYAIDKVAVNVSPYQMQHQNIVKSVEDVLKETGLSHNCLELEITESFIMHDENGTITALKALETLGVDIAIDDFGTGYSSMSHLKHFPISSLKIDRSFVRDTPYSTTDVAISRAIVALGKAMDLRVIAEGVETEGQVEFLVSEGCDVAQGNHFSPPVTATGLEHIMKENC
ncbi:MAG: EAL domain-containing protein [Sedimenticola sp.]